MLPALYTVLVISRLSTVVVYGGGLGGRRGEPLALELSEVDSESNCSIMWCVASDSENTNTLTSCDMVNGMRVGDNLSITCISTGLP